VQTMPMRRAGVALWARNMWHRQTLLAKPALRYACRPRPIAEVNSVYCVCVQESTAPKPLLLAELSVPGNAGRAYGALTADRNPIHLSSLTSQVSWLVSQNAVATVAPA
jgi:hypothetical protein